MAQKHYSSKPLVSVIIPCYNYGKYLEEAVQSVMDQSYENTETIIIDDGSTDDTSKVVRRLMKKHKSLKYIHQENSGIVRTRNLGLKLSRGKYMIQLDADDTLEQNYIEETLKIAEKTGADIVYTNFKTFGNKELASSFPAFNLEELKNHNYIHISSMIRTASINDITFDVNLQKKSHEDWDFFLNLCINGATAELCKSTHLNYRIHGRSRNNILASDENRRQYAEVYSYVINKHNDSHRARVDYLAGKIFADWYLALYKNLEQHSEAIAELREQNSRLLKEKEATLKSRAYRISRKLYGLINK